MFSSVRTTATNAPSRDEIAREEERSRRLWESFRQRSKATDSSYPPLPSDYPSLLPDVATEGTPVILKSSATDHLFDDAGDRDGAGDDSAFRQMLKDNEELARPNDKSGLATASASTRKIMDTLLQTNADFSRSLSNGLPAPITESTQASRNSSSDLAMLAGGGILLFFLCRHLYKSLHRKRSTDKKDLPEHTSGDLESNPARYLLGHQRPY